jgi:5-methylcytosine-specific restriction endonuclease McrA
MDFFRLLNRRDDYSTNDNDGSYLPYAKYRVAIAEDCELRCVYCDSHEDTVGGREAMELDHFRPWQKLFASSGKKEFEHLKNDPNNLVHACGVCNGFKWSHWPTEDPKLCYDHEKGWIDPFAEHRAEFFNVEEDGKLTGKKSPAEYQIIKLRLNRPLLRRQRQLRMLINSFGMVEENWKLIVKTEVDSPRAKIASEALLMLSAVKSLLPPI